MENSNSSKGMHGWEILTIWGLAFAGSLAGSVIISILGVIYVTTSNPEANLEFERGAAIVGAFCGSIFSIPFGIFWGGIVGVAIYKFFSKRNSVHPALPASVAAFVISALLSGTVLVPIGFMFFGLGHI